MVSMCLMTNSRKFFLTWSCISNWKFISLMNFCSSFSFCMSSLLSCVYLRSCSLKSLLTIGPSWGGKSLTGA